MSGNVVYVVGSLRSSLVKIGTTARLDRRLAELQSASPFALEVLWKIEGDATMESLLHRHFKRLRRHGEWFDFDGLDPVAEVSAAVVELRSGPAIEQLPVSTTVRRPRNGKWRRWHAEPTRQIRISDGEWADFGAVCVAEGTNRATDVRAYIARYIAEFREANPGVVLPGDEG